MNNKTFGQGYLDNIHIDVMYTDYITFTTNQSWNPKHRDHVLKYMSRWALLGTAFSKRQHSNEFTKSTAETQRQCGIDRPHSSSSLESTGRITGIARGSLLWLPKLILDGGAFMKSEGFSFMACMSSKSLFARASAIGVSSWSLGMVISAWYIHSRLTILASPTLTAWWRAAYYQ